MGEKLIKFGLLGTGKMRVRQDGARGDSELVHFQDLSGTPKISHIRFILNHSKPMAINVYLMLSAKFLCTSDTHILPEQEIKMAKAAKITLETEITHEQREAAEVEIREKQKTVDYRTTEYPVEVLVKKYRDGLDEDTSELYIPDYQRDMIWEENRQSKFIESIFLGLPIPYIFVADLRPKQEADEDDLGRLEIVDGTQRIRTLDRFLNNDLKLRGLEKLKNLNNFKFIDLPLARQRRFNCSIT